MLNHILLRSKQKEVFRASLVSRINHPIHFSQCEVMDSWSEIIMIDMKFSQCNHQYKRRGTALIRKSGYLRE